MVMIVKIILFQGYFYITTYDGYAYEAPLTRFTGASEDVVLDVSLTPPIWMKRLIRAKTSSRFDGIGTLPMASAAVMTSNTVKSWNEQ
jgi:hypothetical protein